jgi:HlyD family secretion protein
MGERSVRKQKRSFWQTRGKWLAFILVILLVGVGAAWYKTGGTASVFQSQPTTGPDYHTTTVRRGNLQVSTSGQGTLTAGQSVDLSFPAKGILSELDVKAGDSVKAGQTLAKLGNLDSLQAAVANDQYQLLQAQQDLANLQQNANVNLAKALQSMITAQQAYNSAVTTDQRTAYARCDKPTSTKYKAALDLATTHLQQISANAYGSDAWINANNVYQQALANYQYCTAYTPNEKTSAGASLKVAQVSLQNAKQTYDTLNANKGIDPIALSVAQAKVQQFQTQLTQDQQNLQGAVMTAPIDGKVTFVASNVGSMVDTAKFITISDLTQPELQVTVDETDVNKFTVGSLAQVVFDALPNQTFTGKVSQVNPQLTTSGQYNVATGTVTLGPDAAKVLKDYPLGLSAAVTVIQKQANNVVVVPLNAVRDLGGGQYAVFIVGKNGQLQFRPVQVGMTDSASAEITSGLQAGEVISTGSAQTK